ncbi:variant 9, Beta-glucosidase 11, partial [Lathyrus oleraceus]
PSLFYQFSMNNYFFSLHFSIRFLNPLIFGKYPSTMEKNVGSRLPIFTSRESNLVKGSIDFLGVNFYSSFYIKNNPGSLKKKNRDYIADMAVEVKRMIISLSFTAPILIA